MQTFEGPNGNIVFNDEGRDVWIDPTCTERRRLDGYLRELTSLSESIRKGVEGNGRSQSHEEIVSGQVKAAAEITRAHGQGLIAMNPFSFTTDPRVQRVCRQAVDEILASDTLGRSMLEELGAHGLFSFQSRMKHPSNKLTVGNLLRLIVAGLSMSFVGARSIREIPAEGIGAWIANFQEKETSRWKPDCWSGSRDFAYQCIREIVFAYGRLTDHSDIGRLVAMKRSDKKSTFYTNDLMSNPPRHLAPWLANYREFRKENPSINSSYDQMIRFLARWLDENFEPDLVADIPAFLAEPNRKPSFIEYVIACTGTEGVASPKKYLKGIFDCLRRFTALIVRDLGVTGRVGTVFPLVDEKQLKIFSNAVKRSSSGKPIEAKARPLPVRLQSIVKTILEEGEEGWPGTQPICREYVSKKGRIERAVYCPVLPTLILAMLQLPLRMVQLRRLDSGEGDIRMFDGHLLEWQVNQAPAAGYWKAHGFPEQRGYAYEFSGDQSFTGFFVNTNKTGQPWSVPWQNNALHRLLFDMRLWQEKHLPTTQPIGPNLYVDRAEEFEDGALDNLPTIFPLFRLPLDSKTGQQGCPPKYRKVNEFWHLVMQELQRRLALEYPDDQMRPIVKINPKTGQAYGSLYTIHGIRVAGITMLFQQNVPLWVISKLVAGHASVLMTLYYVKMEAWDVHKLLDDVAVSRQAAEAKMLATELATLSFEDAKRRTATISDDGLLVATSGEAPVARSWMDTSLGLCIWAGERCHDGGPKLRTNTGSSGENRHGPVEGGPGNCLLCRHFITGPAWLAPLMLNGSKLLRILNSLAKRLVTLDERLNELRARRRQADKLDSVRLEAEIDRTECEKERLTKEQESVAASVYNTTELVKACGVLLSGTSGVTDENEAARSLVANPGGVSIDFLDVSDFEQAAVLTKAGRIYPVIHSEETETARNRFIDELLWKSGEMPLSFAPVDPKTLSLCQDAFAEMLLNRVEREGLLDLEQGNTTLARLGILDEFKVEIDLVVGKPLPMVTGPMPSGRQATAV